MNSYRTSTWGDEISLEYGKSLKGYQNSNGKYQVFGSNGPIGWTDKPLCKGPGIILGRKGAYRGVKFSEKDFYVIDTAYYVVPKTDLDLNWLYYAIKYHKLGEIDDGSPIPSTTRAAVYVREFDIPSKEVQVKMGNILKKIDLKIELNNQINETLESIAQAIFKSWFIAFDPVRAKIAAKQEGKDSELAAMCVISGKSEVELQQMAKEDFAELQATAALFPDELVESELGEVPREWKVGCIGDEVNTVSKTYPLKQVKEVVFLNTGDILKGKFLHANKSSTEGLPGQAKKSIQKDDILYSEIRPQNKRFAYVHFDAENYVVSTKLMVLRQKSKVPSHFVYFILSQQSTIDFLQVMAESRSGTFPQITFDVLSKVEYLKPNNDALIDIFTRKVLTPFFEKKVIYETENNKLLGIRDIVLPKLLSGQLDLSRLASEAEYESSTE